MPGNSQGSASNAPRLQYGAWGVLVRTSQVRTPHIANGLMQLLRLVPHTPPAWHDLLTESDPAAVYTRAVKTALDGAYGRAWRFSDAARALCVTRSNKGPLRLDSAHTPGEPRHLQAGRVLVRAWANGGSPQALSPDMHEALARALNADGRVRVAGAADPTTPGLSFVGFTDPHTLSGMHAATFLGMLSATPAGCEAIVKLYDLARSSDDPHSALVDMLGLSADLSRFQPVDAASLMGAFPVPSGDGWGGWSMEVGRMALNLVRRTAGEASKGEALTALADLATLVLCLRMLRWAPGASQRTLLCVSSADNVSSFGQAVTQAQRSLQGASVALDAASEGMIIKDYFPSQHARHLGAAGGWLYPLHSQGGAKHYFCPGPRQMVTLTHALVAPGEEVPWPEFAERAERIGLTIGGANEHRSEVLLAVGGVAGSLREVDRTNREHLIALGLARRESDNVVLVDGGAR